MFGGPNNGEVHEFFANDMGDNETLEASPDTYKCKCPNCGQPIDLSLAKAAPAPMKRPAMPSEAPLADESAMLGKRY